MKNIFTRLKYRKTKDKRIKELESQLDYVYKKLRVAESVLFDMQIKERARNEGVDYDKMTLGSKILFGTRLTFDDALGKEYRYNKESGND